MYWHKSDNNLPENVLKGSMKIWNAFFFLLLAPTAKKTQCTFSLPGPTHTRVFFDEQSLIKPSYYADMVISQVVLWQGLLFIIKVRLVGLMFLKFTVDKHVYFAILFLGQKYSGEYLVEPVFKMQGCPVLLNLIAFSKCGTWSNSEVRFVTSICKKCFCHCNPGVVQIKQWSKPLIFFFFWCVAPRVTWHWTCKTLQLVGTQRNLFPWLSAASAADNP